MSFLRVIFIGLLRIDNPINGEGVGYLISAKHWESFTIESIPEFSFLLDNTLDVTYMLFTKYFRLQTHMLRELRILKNNISLMTVHLGRLIALLPLPSLRNILDSFN